MEEPLIDYLTLQYSPLKPHYAGAKFSPVGNTSYALLLETRGKQEVGYLFIGGKKSLRFIWQSVKILHSWENCQLLS